MASSRIRIAYVASAVVTAGVIAKQRQARKNRGTRRPDHQSRSIATQSFFFKTDASRLLARLSAPKPNACR